MIRNLHKSAKNCDSTASGNQKKFSFYDHSDKHGNEVSIILVITDENLQIEELISNKRKKFRHASDSCKTEASDYRDRLNYFNLICSRSEFQNLDDLEKLKKILFKNLQQVKLKKFKKDELDKDSEIRQTKSKKASKNHNIYGPISYIPAKYSRPALPPFFKDKWAHFAKELKEKDSDSDVLTKFLYSKYDFEHSTPSCSSESEKLSDCEPLVRDDSLELRPADFSRSFALDEKIQVGDRPDKNLEIKNKYFRIHENDISNSSPSSSSSSEFTEEFLDNESFSFPISRQSRIFFSESNNQSVCSEKYEANLPKLPDQSSMPAMSKRFEFNSCSNGLGLKYIRKKDTSVGLKNLNQFQMKNLSVITEEENLSSSTCSFISHQENEKIDFQRIDNTNLDENSIQQDIDLASESFSSTASSTQYSDDDQKLKEHCHRPMCLNLPKQNANQLSRKEDDISFKNLYNNYFSLIDKNFTMSIPRQEINNKENLVYI